MQIYTSYIAKQKELEKLGIVCITICAFPPKGFKGPNLAAVAPSKSILLEYKKDNNQEKYIKRYTEEILCILKEPRYLIDTISYISQGKDVALCCYEKSGDFCHRHILANFLNEKLNLNITEFVFPEKEELEVESDSYVLF